MAPRRRRGSPAVPPSWGATTAVVVAVVAAVAVVLLAGVPSCAAFAATHSCNDAAFRVSPALLGAAMGNGQPAACVVTAAALAASPPSACLEYTRLVNEALEEGGMACPARAVAYLAVLGERSDSLW